MAQQVLKQRGFENVLVLSGGHKLYTGVFCPPKSASGDARAAAGAPSALTDVPCERSAEGLSPNIELDLTGLRCPGPLLKIKATVEEMVEGQVLRATISDRGFLSDAETWCQHTGNRLLSLEDTNGLFIVTIQKGQGAPAPMGGPVQRATGKTMVIFSGDLDKVMASFIIANGAAAMGDKVTMFFTFWGLNVLRKEEHIPAKKGLLDKMFGAMMPRGANKLKLSKMNMGGMGTKMMRYVMKSKQVPSLPELIETAQKNGIRMVVCTMSMDVMGLKQEELIDGLEYGGVATFLGSADESNMTLFI
jgi:peroxiredoxin family protein/TusA-related sulfurtransferase